MNLKCSILICLALFQIGYSRPQNKKLNPGRDLEEPETKVRGKRKYEIPLLRQLEESGVGVQRTLDEEKDKDQSKVEVKESLKESVPTDVKKKTAEQDQSPDVPPNVDEPTTRVKKQSLNNIGGCGKTVCGPVVSARGSVVNDMTSLLQSGKPVVTLGDLNPPVVNHMNPMSQINQMGQMGQMGQMSDPSSKVGQTSSPLQARTIDTLLGISPFSLGSLGGLGYGTPALYSGSGLSSSAVSSDSNLGYGHAFFKPPAMPAIPAVAIVSQHAPHPLIHPWLMPHLMPHIMPHLLPSLSTAYITPHRFEGQRLPEVVQNDVKQPVPLIPQPSFVNAENTLVCQPYRSQRLESPYDYVYKPDLPIDKSLNVSESSKNAYGNSPDEERRIHEHLKKVNEIKEEISQLNRAAQRIVDQQERLTEMQQKQLWTNSGSTFSPAMDQTSNTYMGSGYNTHSAMPWGYSRSNILSYPNSHDDIDFFMNLLRMAKRVGLVSDSFQSSASSTVGEIAKGLQEPSKIQKEGLKVLNDMTDGVTPKPA